MAMIIITTATNFPPTVLNPDVLRQISLLTYMIMISTQGTMRRHNCFAEQRLLARSRRTVGGAANRACEGVPRACLSCQASLQFTTLGTPGRCTQQPVKSADSVRASFACFLRSFVTVLVGNRRKNMIMLVEFTAQNVVPPQSAVTVMLRRNTSQSSDHRRKFDSFLIP